MFVLRHFWLLVFVNGLVFTTVLKAADPDLSDEDEDHGAADVVDGEEEEDDEDSKVHVDTDEGTAADDSIPGSTLSGAGTEEEVTPQAPEASVYADVHIHFVKPAGSGSELAPGKDVKILIGFTNKGTRDFMVDHIETSFRYPQDYSYYIQNFTMVNYKKLVPGERQATFAYGFTPAESLHGRPFGLTILLNYHDVEDERRYVSTVFNDTVSILEPDENFDGETFFLYVTLVAIVILLLVGAYQLFIYFGGKHLKTRQQQQTPVERGTQHGRDDVDLSWIPKEILQNGRTSPKRSPKEKTSPRRRNRRIDG